jgi:S1-C subfamily serine protease
VKIVRDRTEHTRTVAIEAMPIDIAGEARSTTPDDTDGLTLEDIDRSTTADSSVPTEIDGALIVSIVSGSAADDAELAVGDIIRVINNRAVHTRAEAMRELHAIEAGRPLFLLVWREGTDAFLRMRRN